MKKILAGVILVIAISGVSIFKLMPKSVLQNEGLNPENRAVQYVVENCTELQRTSQNYYEYSAESKLIRAFIVVNCGSDEILVEKDGVYRIIERDHDGILYKCLCQREVRIFNASDSKVEFLSISGEIIRLEKEIEFCGWSTYGECKSDAECVIDGCSGQVCRSVLEEPVITTCEWRDCYRNSVRCACINSACQWVKI
ncbi:MAG: eight-cysteine-cluster domain-containing protein [Archaeoglobaceae archaeon]|nr:eight-cysteine-cluster domain-containing protein [Archaeoglobaceae archaeon]